VAGWGLNVRIAGDQGRTISVDQLAANLGSVVGANSAQAPGNLDANVRFRDRLWSATLHKVKADQKVLTGLGFGVNIAKAVGLQGTGPVQLRSPHNSHLDIYARMGLIGITIWIALWGLWCITMLRARSMFRALGRRLEMGLVEVSIVAAVAILINSYFDPTLESPQVAIWLWTFVGIGLGLVAIARRATSVRRTPGTALVISR
jgi:O-antigen ligase